MSDVLLVMGRVLATGTCAATVAAAGLFVGSAPALASSDTVSTYGDLVDAFTAGGTVALGADISQQSSNLVTGGTGVTLDLHGHTLTLRGGDWQAGIGVAADSPLTVTDTSADAAGVLNATGGDEAAGIGGYGNSPVRAGSITVTAGRVYARGGIDGAGIGAQLYTPGPDMTVSGGHVEATGGDRAAGIGGGLGDPTRQHPSGSLTVTGGEVTAHGGAGGAGIGGGSRAPGDTGSRAGGGGTLTVSAGQVTAVGGTGGAGVGGGSTDNYSTLNGGAGSTVNLSGGTLDATAGTGAAAVGGGRGGSNGGYAVRGGDGGSVTIGTGATLIARAVDAPPVGGGRGMNGGRDGAAGVMNNSGTLTTSQTVTTYGNLFDAFAAGGTVLLGADISQQSSNAVTGGTGVTLDLHGHTLTLSGGDYQAGIGVAADSPLTVTDTSADAAGVLNATGGDEAAGIGGYGNMPVKAGSITVTAGRVRAHGGRDGAGIGAQLYAPGPDVTVSGGHVEATGGDRAAGIGGGLDDFTRQLPSGSLTVTGGEVVAHGGAGGAGIGGGSAAPWDANRRAGSGGTLTVSAGQVTAVGGTGGAGVGGGGTDGYSTVHGGPGGTVNLSGGTLDATAGTGAAAVGGGRGGSNGGYAVRGGDGGTVTIGAGATLIARAVGGSTVGGGRGMNGGQDGAAATVNNSGTLVFPAIPARPTVTAGDHSLTISWTVVSEATGYQYSLDNGVHWSAPSTAHTAIVRNLTAGRSYPVTVRALFGAVSSSASVATAGVPLAVPAAPARPTVIAGNHQLTIRWTAVRSATGYQYSINDGRTWSARISARSATVSRLANGTRYRVRVRALNGPLTGPASPAAIGTPSR
ncbi:beta strand repeat-containing protein [Krasilnikovia sp. MM14-A1004]|uniref:beta strand repeat-containing protein n=1 Tax=Krasilnikovia sp. MM14-A1004 TaxID=3373541 RepID=UPI00399C8281